jgi:hypothetical protein
MTIPTQTINDVNVRNITIPNVNVFNYDLPTPLAPGHPTVTEYIGRPIVNIPGCVEAHPDDRNAQNLPEDDSSKVMTLCDGEVPSYDAMNYEPEQLTIIQELPPPDVVPPPDPPGAPEVPDTSNVSTEVECPAPNQPRIGDVAQNQKEKVSGYELREGICVILYEDIGPVEQYLPSAQVATTTAVIATVAGASALLAKPLADLLLRVFRPAIKKVLTKANGILGRKTVKPSRSEIQTEEYRKKRGLPSLKKRR